ncbi:hypothetical protein E4K10_00885 [Streptomyces sp. T1317-0309]|nr:hypothetical protein E4K10_00885 [Streptomyces sp. T1317-0309]
MIDGQRAPPTPVLPVAGSTGGRVGSSKAWDWCQVLGAIVNPVQGRLARGNLPARIPRTAWRLNRGPTPELGARR